MSKPDYIALMAVADDFCDMRNAICGLLLAFPEIPSGEIRRVITDPRTGDLLVTGRFRARRTYRVIIKEEPS